MGIISQIAILWYNLAIKLIPSNMKIKINKFIGHIAVFAAVVFYAVPLLVHASPNPPGTNIKAPNGTIYLLMNGTRRPYTSAGAFLSYGFNSFATVVEANADDLLLPEGSFIPPQDGKIICSDRGTDKGTCYEISDGAKAGFTSEQVFRELGFSFSNSTFADVSWMPPLPNISNSTDQHRKGTLISIDGTIYLVGEAGLLGIPNVATFQSWGYSFQDVVIANSNDRLRTQVGVMPIRTPDYLNPNNSPITQPPVTATSPQDIYYNYQNEVKATTTFDAYVQVYNKYYTKAKIQNFYDNTVNLNAQQKQDIYTFQKNITAQANYLRSYTNPDYGYIVNYDTVGFQQYVEVLFRSEDGKWKIEQETIFRNK